MKTKIAQFNHFEIEMPVKAARACSHSGECDNDVAYWAPRIKRDLERCSPGNLARELLEYGAWEESELKDDSANWRRIIWIAAGNIMEENG